MDAVKVGEYVKIYNYTARVFDVFLTEDGRLALEVHFAKDIARGKTREVHIIDHDIVEKSTLGEFSKEFISIMFGHYERFDDCVCATPE